MWFVFAAGLWVICVVLMVVLFVYKKRKARGTRDMVDPVAEVWYNALSGEVRLGESNELYHVLCLYVHVFTVHTSH